MMKFAQRMKVLFVGTTVVLSTACLSSCQSVQEQPVPVDRQPVAHVVGAQPVDTSVVSQKRNTNTFPTFGPQLTAAGAQMSDDEATQMENSLSSLSAARGRGAVSAADYNRRVQELRAIGAGPAQ